jgi:hypothetical protein
MIELLEARLETVFGGLARRRRVRACGIGVGKGSGR